MEDVGVDHRRPHVLVPQQFLNGPDVVPGLEQMGGKGVPQSMRGHALGDTRFPGRLLDGPLQTGRVNVMAVDRTAAGVHRTLGRREKILPDELTGCIGVLSFQCIGEIDLPVPGGQVLLVEQTHPLYLAAQFRDDRFGKRDNAVLLALAIPDGDGAVCKIHVLDTQADALHQAQAGAVEELSHQLADVVQVIQKAANLVPGEDGGEALGPFGRGEKDGVNLFVEAFPGEEEDGAEGLVLGRCGDVPLHDQVGQEGLDFWGAHLGRVAFIVEEDEAAHLVHVGLFGAVGIMLEPENFTELV